MLLAVVDGIGRLDEPHLGAQVALRALDALPGRLVEALVVDLADVGDQADAQAARARRGGLIRATRGRRGNGRLGRRRRARGRARRGTRGRARRGTGGWACCRDSPRGSRLDSPRTQQPALAAAAVVGLGGAGAVVGAACGAGWQATSTSAVAHSTAPKRREIDVSKETSEQPWEGSAGRISRRTSHAVLQLMTSARSTVLLCAAACGFELQVVDAWLGAGGFQVDDGGRPGVRTAWQRDKPSGKAARRLWARGSAGCSTACRSDADGVGEALVAADVDEELGGLTAAHGLAVGGIREQAELAWRGAGFAKRRRGHGRARLDAVLDQEARLAADEVVAGRVLRGSAPSRRADRRPTSRLLQQQVSSRRHDRSPSRSSRSCEPAPAAASRRRSTAR